MTVGSFRLAEWLVDPAGNALSNGALRRQVEPRAMDVLRALCRQAGEVVSVDALLLACWGSTQHGDNPVHKTITQLRQVLGDDAKAPQYIETIRKRGYRVVAAVVFEPVAGAPPLAGSWQHGSPFRGLQSFSETDAAIFFGRQDSTQRLLEAATQQAQNGNGLILLLGPSGCGKTSLVQAGLLPALAKAQHREGSVMPLAFTSIDLADIGQHALPAMLGSALLDWQIGDEPVWVGYSGAVLGDALAKASAVTDAILRAAVSAARANHTCPRLILFVDRFEVLYTSAHIDEAARQAAMLMLEALCRSGAVLTILACRNDFYPRLVEYPLLIGAKRNGGHVDLLPPSPAEIAQIIRLPALAANLSFGVDPVSGARLDDILCSAVVGNADALPLLQHTLQELFRLRSDTGELRIEALAHLGGVEGAIGQRAEEIVNALTAEQRAALPRVLSLLVSLVGMEEGVTARSVPWSALRDDAERQLAGALVEARLFVSELIGTEAGFGLAHEALLRRWPRVTEWVDAHRHALRVRGRVAAQAAHWAGSGRPPDLLLPLGIQLDEALRLRNDKVLSLTPDELSLIEQSGQRAGWRRRLRLCAVGAIAGLAAIATAFGWSAMHAQQAADQRRAEAEGLMEFMLGDFAEKLRPLGRLDLLDSVSIKALQYLTGSGENDWDATSLTQRAKALQVLAEVHFQRGNSTAALDALQAASAILLRQFGSAPQSPGVIKQLGANAFWQGQIYMDHNRWSEAEHQFQLYQSYSDRLFALDSGSIDAWIEQSYAHTNLGMLALKRDQPGAAAAQFERSLALKTRALEQRPQDKALRAELANSLSWLASAHEANGALASAAAIYARELQVVEALHLAVPGEALWTTRMANSLQRRSKLAMAMGQESTAMATLGQALDLLGAALERDPNNRVWQATLAIAELDRLRMQAEHGQAATLLPALTALAARTEALTRLDPKKVDWARLHALTRQTRALALLKLGRAGEARALIGQVVQELGQLHRNNPADARLGSDLAKTLLSQADIAAAAQDHAATVASCEQAGKLLAKAAASTDYRLLDPWIRAQLCLNHRSAIAAAHQRLSQIGYREPAYLRFLSTHP